MPTNLYGPGDNYHSENSHVIPALIRRFHEAKIENSDCVTAWGSGVALREFLYVDDMAHASIHIMNLSDLDIPRHTSPHINVGSGYEISIKHLTEIVAKTVGFSGDIRWDQTKPDGAPRKLLDTSILKNMGWESEISLKDGLKYTYHNFLDNLDTYRKIISDK
jgi:GDP-L-fucose synthase